MPRKPLLYIPDFPYHVTARSNNREWFYLPKEDVWRIFVTHLNSLISSHGVLIHAFVLMDNHYHLLLTTGEKFTLGHCMQFLQKSVSRSINEKTKRINHVFGGPYKGCLVSEANHYHHVLKYVYRNPVKAGISQKVEEYMYSTLINNKTNLVITGPLYDIDRFIPNKREDFLKWLNQGHNNDQDIILRKVLRKTNFKLVAKDLKLFK